MQSILLEPWKSALLFMVYTLVIFVLASVLFFTQSLKREAMIVLQGAPEIIVQKMAAGRHDPMPTRYQEKIKNIRGVMQVRKRLWGYYYDPVIGANYTLMVPENPSVTPGNIIIGNGIAKARMAVEGDTLEFYTHDGVILELNVKDHFSPESALIASDLIVMTENDFRRLFGLPKELVTDLVLKVENPRELSAIASRIAKALPDTRQISREDILRTYGTIFSWRGGLLITILMAALLAFFILAWDKASGLSSEEKREIGILKAIGWETSDILLLKFWEGLIISLSSFLSGILLAYLHIFLGSAILFSPVIKGWSVLYPDFKLVPFMNMAQLSALFFLAVVPYIVSTIIPSWRTARTDPDSVMR